MRLYLLIAAFLTAFLISACSSSTTTTNGTVGKCLYLVFDTLEGKLPPFFCSGQCVPAHFAKECKKFSLSSTAPTPATFVITSTSFGGVTLITPTATCDTTRCNPATTATKVDAGPIVTMP